MTVDTPRQLLRWTVPGTVFVIILIAAGTVLCVPLTCDVSPPQTVEVAFLFASVLPVGFLLYQLYFLGYHRGRRIGTPVDRSLSVLLHLREHAPAGSLESLAWRTGWPLENADGTMTTSARRVPLLGTLNILKKEHRDRRSIHAFQRRHAENAAVLMTLIESITDDARPGREWMRTEYTTLSDIYHAQGASRSAIAWGSILSLAFFSPIFFDGPVGSWSLHAVVTASFGIALWLVLHHSRTHTLNRLVATLQYGLMEALFNTPDA